MNKKIFILVFVMLFGIIIFGCEKKSDDVMLSGGWQTVLTNSQVNISESELNIFNYAKSNYTDMNLEAVALLAKQVVAGTNYMFLAEGNKANEEKVYKIVIVYNNLEGKSTITSVSDFDYINYVNKDIENNSKPLLGGWYTDSSSISSSLDSEFQEKFDDATTTLTGQTYKPIAVVGKQIVAGTNYAILCYGKASYEGMNEAIYMITLYEDLNNNHEIISQAYIDLSKYN